MFVICDCLAGRRATRPTVHSSFMPLVYRGSRQVAGNARRSPLSSRTPLWIDEDGARPRVVTRDDPRLSAVVGTRSGSRQNHNHGPSRSLHRRDDLFTPARVPERPRETLAPKLANGGVGPCSPVMAVGRSETLPDPRPPRKPCQTRARKRKRRRGLSAAFPENQGAGCFRNRPGNSGGRI